MAIALLVVGLIIGAGLTYGMQASQLAGIQAQLNDLTAKNASLEAQLATLQGVQTKQLKVFAVFATPIEEPWDNVIHQALLKAQTELNIAYSYSDKNGYGPDFEKALRDVAAKGYDIIFGDAFQLRLQALGLTEITVAGTNIAIPFQLFLMLPYLLTIVFLAIASRTADYPTALLTPYNRE